MIQYQNGSFSPIMEAEDVIKLFLKGVPKDVTAIHFGTVEQLKAKRDSRPFAIPNQDEWSLDPPVIVELRDRVDNLERRMNGEIAIYGVEDLARFERALRGKDKP